MRMMNFLSRSSRAVAFGGLLLVAGGCDAVSDLLQAENPARIQEEEVNNAELVPILVNSVIGEFQDMYADPFIWRGSMFTDEQITGINWEQTARLSQRIIQYNEGDADLMFSELSQARMMADTVAGRLRVLLEGPAEDERMATVLAYGGYSYVLMGEAMCEATINVGDEIHSPEALFGMAISRFEEALQVANNAGREDIANLARVGLARAYLSLGNTAEVMRYAAEVPSDFTWWVEYSSARPEAYNTLYTRTHGGNHSLGVHPEFLNGTFGEQEIIASQTDPRIQHTPDWTYGHNALTLLYKPFQPLSYSEYTGDTVAEACVGVPDCTEEYLIGSGALQLPEQDTDIKLASGLEALHHYYEAAGAAGTGPAGTTLEFVNARRAFGNQAPVAVVGGELMAELRAQRARDLYLAGFRLGDLRRWMRQGVGDFFPQGEHPTTQWGAYGDATCYPLPLEEYEGNPGISRPA